MCNLIQCGKSVMQTLYSTNPAVVQGPLVPQYIGSMNVNSPVKQSPKAYLSSTATDISTTQLAHEESMAIKVRTEQTSQRGTKQQRTRDIDTNSSRRRKWLLVQRNRKLLFSEHNNKASQVSLVASRSVRFNRNAFVDMPLRLVILSKRIIGIN